VLQPIHLIVLFVFVLGCQNNPSDLTQNKDIIANEWPMTGFVKADSINPILVPEKEPTFVCPVSGKEVQWEQRNVLNPSAVVRNNQVYLLYRAQDNSGTSRIGLAISEDGLHFKKLPRPVFYPDNDEMKKYEWHHAKIAKEAGDQDYFDGVEDPRIVESEDGSYFMTYTSYDGLIARLCLASSTDLKTWIKHGPVLSDENNRDAWSKSGAIICRLEGDRILATKINGKYWMYYGDTDIFMATSIDLINWQPVTDEESGQPISVLHPRPGYFDSRLVEPGPYALIQNDGILFIYNASNAANLNDPNLPRFSYAAGQALFDRHLPYRLIDRSDSYFIYPDKDYERVGEVNEVCFVEGLVHFKEKWFLYYGTADSKIAVAVSDHAVKK
jgi:predicted GH43/DUF377 family glycosyl hydrolase